MVALALEAKVSQTDSQLKTYKRSVLWMSSALVQRYSHKFFKLGAVLNPLVT